jgi:hypothetical protein
LHLYLGSFPSVSKTLVWMKTVVYARIGGYSWAATFVIQNILIARGIIAAMPSIAAFKGSSRPRKSALS